MKLPSSAQSAAGLYTAGTAIQAASLGVNFDFYSFAATVSFVAGNTLMAISRDRQGHTRQWAINAAYSSFSAGAVFLRGAEIQTTEGASLYISGLAAALLLDFRDKSNISKGRSPASFESFLIDKRNVIAGAGQAISRLPILSKSISDISSGDDTTQKMGVAVTAFTALWLIADLFVTCIKTEKKQLFR